MPGTCSIGTSIYRVLQIKRKNKKNRIPKKKFIDTYNLTGIYP